MSIRPGRFGAQGVAFWEKRAPVEIVNAAAGRAYAAACLEPTERSGFPEVTPAIGSTDVRGIE